MLNTNVSMIFKSCVPYPRSTSLKQISKIPMQLKVYTKNVSMSQVSDNVTVLVMHRKKGLITGKPL